MEERQGRVESRDVFYLLVDLCVYLPVLIVKVEPYWSLLEG